MPKHRYGWVRDLPDQRDFKFALAGRVFAPSVDLRSLQPPVYDQGQLGSCVANAICSVVDFLRIKAGKKPYFPSRRFEYYNGLALEGSLPADDGMTIRDGFKVGKKLGFCTESEWPYSVPGFAIKPHEQCYRDALMERETSYASIRTVADLKVSLTTGFCPVIGISVYESFEDAKVTKTGIIPMPGSGESLLGGHAIEVVGYLPIKGHIYHVFKNSWGKGWGDKGYGYIPEAYLANPDLGGDFWELKKLTK